jgi:hypothetical protein
MKRSESKKHRRRISMKPIVFSCKKTLDLAPEEIAGKILDVTEWPNFKGFGPIPGIKVAEFEIRVPEIVGSRIRVINTDGSKYVEEIIEWEPNRRIRLHMKEFSAPLYHLATRIEETCEFERVGHSTNVIRSYQLHAKYLLSRPLLWMISFFLKRAVARHLEWMGSLSE